MPLRVTITPAGQAACYPRPLVLRESVNRVERILYVVNGTLE